MEKKGMEEGMEKQDKQKRGRRIREEVWLDLAHPRHLQTKLDWDSLAIEVGVGKVYLREVLARRRNGSLPLLERIARQMGKNAVAREKVFRLLTGTGAEAAEPK